MNSHTFQKGQIIVGHYYQALDGMRAAAFLLVLLFHCAVMAAHVCPGGPPDNFFVTLSFAGWLGVDLFFVLSGFLITGILIDTIGIPGQLRKFYIRRSLRIFPLYYLVLLLTLGILLFLPGFTWDSRPLFYIFYVQNWLFLIDELPIIPLAHFWSLAVEEQFYLIWPVLFLFAYRRSMAWPLCLALLAGATVFRLTYITTDTLDHLSQLTLVRLDPLICGAILAILVRGQLSQITVRRILRVGLVCSTAGLIFAYCVLGGFYVSKPGTLLFSLPFFAVFFACLIGMSVVSDRDWPLNRIMQLPALVRLGRISYGLYVFHWPLVYILANTIFHEAPGGYWPTFFLLFAATGVTSLLLAVYSYKAWERPFLQLKDRYAPYPD